MRLFEDSVASVFVLLSICFTNDEHPEYTKLVSNEHLLNNYAKLVSFRVVWEGESLILNASDVGMN